MRISRAGNATSSLAELSDVALVERAAERDPEAFRTIMRRHNQRLFRIARGIVRDDATAEDVVQEAYTNAFRHLGDFRKEAALSTWLQRIVINEALGRLRSNGRRREIGLDEAMMSGRVLAFPHASPLEDPEKTMAQRQILKLIETATDDLPEEFRLVFIARVIEEMSVEETAELLSIKPETVRTRLYRARALLRRRIDRQIGPLALEAFPFAGWRCERLTEKVLSQLGLGS